MKTPKEIKIFLNNKVLTNINLTAKEIISGNAPNIETISIYDFTEWLENKPKEILVPDNIKIVKFFPDIEAPNLGLVFNEGKQILNHRIEYNCYAVYPYVRFFYKEIKCKLIPTLFQDIEVGDMFFNDSDWGNLDNLINYSMYLGGGKFAFIYNNGVMIDDKPKENVYKVVPINN